VKAIYRASTRSLLEIPELIEQPDMREWKELPINCSHDFKDGKEYEEGKDYVVLYDNGPNSQPVEAKPVVTPALEFQDEVQRWMLNCFGPEISKDKIERNHRFLEEALELVQSLGCTRSEALQLVDYTFSRPEGEPYQEVGGVMVTLAALCSANNLNMKDCGEKEIARAWTKIDKIREKQFQKPKFSPLPQ
jgi:hypothetical protein